jgi:hypothetical protein
LLRSNNNLCVDATPRFALSARPRDEPGYLNHHLKLGTTFRFCSGGVALSARRYRHSGGGLT